MELEVTQEKKATEVGSYFVSNYPPYSVWSPEHVPAAVTALDTPVERRCADGGSVSPPLGLYLHIPFCRKRCEFCYFRVYTDKNARDVDVYIDALAREVALYAECAGIGGRQFEFVYFGGGTPSFLSSEQLLRLIDGISRHWTWDAAREVTFECEPGTLKKGKLETIKAIGVTRLSLGIEHFDDAVLEINGRAHKSPEVYRSYGWARDVGFDQINIDLIAGMVGETERKWIDTVEKALALAPDSVTIYQMEVPHNTVLWRTASRGGEAIPVADWPTKRRWVDHAFKVFEAAGYDVSSAYTLVKRGDVESADRDGGETSRGLKHAAREEAEPSRRLKPEARQEGEPSRGLKPAARGGAFVYRDALWHGADMVGTGVASFSHFAGVHYQNLDGWAQYIESLEAGRLPIHRALPVSKKQLLIREMILQMKTGRLDRGYFREKFGVDIAVEFADGFAALVQKGFATVGDEQIRLSREGLLRVDGLLPYFFEPAFRDIRYT
ncbi:MAG: coproporphyrinogen III oxidase family protein [Planctomycetes bacterium]|nr:coproporphyrinogen III oxidase family protein [Planctomycetota bacterium]